MARQEAKEQIDMVTTQKFTDDELAYLSATEQIRLFKAGTITPTDVLEAQVRRVKKYNGEYNSAHRDLKDELDTFNAGKVNAITFDCFAEARKLAKEAEARYRSGTARPIEGVTVGVKNDHDVRGWRHDDGSLLADALGTSAPGEEDDDIAERLRAAGAILVFQTTVPEFCMSCQTWSRLYGVTRNPWNLFYGSGGSSGGSGAALAAGFCTLATGTDMGGSIRIPSAMNGLYGFKPPFGRVPCMEGAYSCCGPMARTFDDMVLLQNVLCGPSAKVHYSLRPKLDYPSEYRPIKGERVAVDYFRSWLPDGLDRDVSASMDRAAAALKAAGAEVAEVDLGWKASELWPLFLPGLLNTDLYGLCRNGDRKPELLCPYAAKVLDVARKAGPEDSVRSAEAISRMHQEVQKAVFAQGCIALVTPTLVTPRVPADFEATPESKADVNGRKIGTLSICLTWEWNMMNAYPVVDLPVGLSDRSVPVGVQVVGNTFDDLAAFGVSAALSKALPQLYRDGRFPDFHCAQ